jgi:hypothetical protein
MIYYFENAGISNGPCTKEELKNRITKATLVWCEGMSDWAKASDVQDLQDLFRETPPPLPKLEKIIKVEASIKKEKTEVFTEKNQTQVANEIKSLFFIAITALFIGVISLIVTQQNSDYNKYNSLLAGFMAYDNDYSAMINSYPVFGEEESQKIYKWLDGNKSRMDSLVSVSKTYDCYRETNDLGFPRSDEDGIKTNIKDRIKEINDKAFSVARN